jgi:Leucine-rich repeat (LRR) protein
MSNQRLVELPKNMQLSKMSHITRFHAPGNQLSTLPSEFGMLRDLREVVLASNAFRELPRVLLQISGLVTLDMSRNRLSHLPADLQLLQSTVRLKLNRNKLKDIPVTIGYLHKLEVFDVSSNRLTRLPDSVGMCVNLRQISIAANFITELPESLSTLVHLDTLLCHTNRLTKLPSGLKSCRSLRKLNISDNILSEIPTWFKHLTNLDSLKFMLNQINGLPSCIGRLTNLASLVGARNRISAVPPSISRLAKLELLDLGRNIIQFVPKELSQLTGLKRLCLSDNKIREIPPELAALNKTTILLSGNRLWSLPFQLSQPEFEAGGGVLDIHKNPFGAFPDIVRGDPNAVLKFLRNLKRKSTWRRVKLVLLGEENVGKTSLRSQLIKQAVKRNPLHVQLTQGALSGHSHFHPHSASTKKKLRSLNSDSGDPVATDGIEIDEYEVYVDALETFEPSQQTGESADPAPFGSTTSASSSTPSGPGGPVNFHKISFSCWDFAGQDLYYGTHQFFLTRHSVHLIVFNMLDEKASKVEYWLKTLKVRVGDVPVVIVGTHRDDKRCDKKYREQVIRSMKKRFDSRFPFIRGYVSVSCKTGKGMPELERLVLQIATRQIIEKHGEVPQAYLLLDGVLRDKRIHHQHMSHKEFTQLAASCGVPEKYMSHCLEFMNDAGVIIYYNEETSRGNGSGLSDIVILDPQLIVDLMASVITLKHSYARDGILPLDALPHIWRDYSEDKYQWLLKLLEKFEIAYSLDPSALANVRGGTFGSSSPEGGSAPQSGDEIDFRSGSGSLAGFSLGTSEPAPKLSRRSQSDPSLDSAISNASASNAQKAPPGFALNRRKSANAGLTAVFGTPPQESQLASRGGIRRKSSTGSLGAESAVSEGRTSSLQELGSVIIVPSLLPEEPDQSQLLEHWESGRSRWSLVCGRRYLCKFLPLGFFSRLIVRILHLPKLRPLYYWKNGIILERGSERALIEYDDVEFVVDFTVKTKPDGDQPSWSLVRQLVENVEALLIGWYRLRPQVLVPCSHCLGAKYLHTDPHHEMQMLASIPLPFDRSKEFLGLSTTPTVTAGQTSPFRFPTDAGAAPAPDSSTTSTSMNPMMEPSLSPQRVDASDNGYYPSEIDDTTEVEDTTGTLSSSPPQESSLAFLGDSIAPFYFSIEECMLAVQEGKEQLTCVRVLKSGDKATRKWIRAKSDKTVRLNLMNSTLFYRMVPWCSRLSRLVYTEKVSGSIPLGTTNLFDKDGNFFFFDRFSSIPKSCIY